MGLSFPPAELPLTPLDIRKRTSEHPPRTPLRVPWHPEPPPGRPEVADDAGASADHRSSCAWIFPLFSWQCGGGRAQVRGTPTSLPGGLRGNSP